MLSKNHSQRFLKQMSCTVILLCGTARRLADLHCNSFTDRKHTAGHITYMANLSALQMNRILYYKTAARAGNHTSIASLSAHSGIKRRFLHQNRSVLSICQRLYNLAFCCQNGNL